MTVRLSTTLNNLGSVSNEQNKEVILRFFDISLRTGTLVVEGPSRYEAI